MDMLTPKAPRQAPAEVNPVLSVRLTAGELARLEWLTEHLNMTKSELAKALINQEYLDQCGVS
jgi:hypothetical protein